MKDSLGDFFLELGMEVEWIVWVGNVIIFSKVNVVDFIFEEN